MSIYATLAHIGVKRFGDKSMVEILVQGVPPHIDYTGPEWSFLPPPVDSDGKRMRAVFFVEPGEEKGTARCGQEYVRALLVMTGEEYEHARFTDVMVRLETALDARYGHRPSVIITDPDGNRRELP